jgi:tetratricopeptide (TPR) repeat protein
MLRIYLFLGLLCLAMRSAQSQPQTNAADAAMQRDFQAAMAAEDSGDLDRAQSLFSSLHVRHPGIFEIDESLGLLYAGRENYSQALPLLEAAVRERPASGAAHANLGAALYKLHRNRDALIEFEQAVKIDPRSVTAQQSLGQVLLDEHKPDRAVEAFSAALRLKPGDDDLTFSYAAALVACTRFDEAAQALSSAATSGQSALAQSLLGEIDEKKGNFQSALQHFNRAVELEPTEENAWSLGVELLRHWTFDAAIREFEAATVKFPDSARMKFGLGAAYFGDSKFTAAVPVFADLLDADKNNALYAELLGMACTSVSGSTESPRCSGLLAYADTHPRDAKAAAYAASMLLNDTATEEQLSTARKLLERALAADPKLPDAQYQMGVLMQNRGDWAGSIANLERAIALKPDFAQAHYHLALAYWRTGRKQEGQAEMELQKKYSKQEAQDLDRRLRQITTFVVDVRN